MAPAGDGSLAARPTAASMGRHGAAGSTSRGRGSFGDERRAAASTTGVRIRRPHRRAADGFDQATRILWSRIAGPPAEHHRNDVCRY